MQWRTKQRFCQGVFFNNKKKIPKTDQKPKTNLVCKSSLLKSQAPKSRKKIKGNLSLWICYGTKKNLMRKFSWKLWSEKQEGNNPVIEKSILRYLNEQNSSFLLATLFSDLSESWVKSSKIQAWAVSQKRVEPASHLNSFNIEPLFLRWGLTM